MKIAAYGTLRDGLHSAKYLTDKYGLESVRDLGPLTISGYKLYAEWMPSLDIWCPFAVLTTGSTMVVSILDIADGEAADDIDRGESWAYDKKVLWAKDEPTYIYQAKRGYPRPWKQPVEIPDGDYVKWAKGGFKP